ncbi:MAG: efflux RND transporter periplasmic adaptor subunit [Porticoccaceae bacterium]|nr:efflux RND transporter periplasmic adaptor subunit [Porticoccaceae bacterium]
MNNNVRLALIFSLAIVAWFASGLLTSTDPVEVVSQSPSKYTKVLVAYSEQQLFSPTVSLRAKTKANRAVRVLAQVSGKISATLIEEGDAVEKGQGICQIDPEDRHFRLAQARAALENADIAYRGAQKLKSAGYQSELAISQAKAALASARTNVKRAQLDIENLQITAPFDGIVESRPVEVGDFVAPGSHCATVVELNPLKIEALVTESEIGSLSKGDQAVVDVDGKEYRGAQLTYLAIQAHPVTKGYRVEATMENADQSIRAGVSAQMDIDIAGVSGHLVPASTILLNDLGETVVRVVDSSQIVRSFRVNAVGETSQGIWVTGLPDEIVLITVGQNYVIDGERVEAAFPDNNSPR